MLISTALNPLKLEHAEDKMSTCTPYVSHGNMVAESHVQTSGMFTHPPWHCREGPRSWKNFGRSVLVLHSDRRPLRPKRIPPDTGLSRNGAAEAGRVWRSLLGLPGLSTSWWDAVRYGSSTKQNTPHGRQHETAPRSANARKLMRTYTNVCQSYVTWCKLVIFAWQLLHTKTEVTSLRFASQKCLRLRFAVQKIRVPRLTVLCAPSLNMRKKENIVFEKTRMHGLAKKKVNS